MLRITIHDCPDEFRLRLEGRLAGPWVREAELCWETAESIVRGRPVVVDLRDVDFVDAGGEHWIAAMHARGAKFLSASPMTAYLVRQITGTEEIAEPSPALRRKGRLRLLLSLFLTVAALAYHSV